MMMMMMLMMLLLALMRFAVGPSGRLAIYSTSMIVAALIMDVRLCTVVIHCMAGPREGLGARNSPLFEKIGLVTCTNLHRNS